SGVALSFSSCCSSYILYYQVSFSFFFLMLPRPPSSTLFPYTTLFRSDFVGKNEKFVNFVKGVAATVAACNPADLDALMACKYDGTDLTVQEQQQEMVLVIGENIKVRRFARFAEGFCVPYIHAGGKIGVLVSLNVEGDIDATEIGKDVAMQIAALNPRFWDKSQVTQDVLAEEMKIMLVQMANDPKM